MTTDEFVAKYNGKGVDFDGYYGFQCMDLYQQYNREVIGAPHIPANAYQVWDKYPKDFYTRINKDPLSIPQKGDVIIWNQNVGGGFGHIAVFLEGDVNKFKSFDQNWGGSVAHIQDHTYSSVVGWLRPKKEVNNDYEKLFNECRVDRDNHWNELQETKNKLQECENKPPVEKIIEKRVEVPTPVEKIIEVPEKKIRELGFWAKFKILFS